ncbi:hypothetical protein [Acetobacter persici]|uniref:Uncharacterized protein n=1 Tax=Acetobacter persici TaxID=1076596 RepID=A0A1U9LJS6_9PROT|nr:hypothetical protein [Acetobacter persici]AQT06714.1 hypothetical protein A0U91_17070 [Acetobacter persici]
MAQQTNGRYVVGSLSCDDAITGFWGETLDDGRYLPRRFDSENEANAAIREMADKTLEAYHRGNMASPSSVDDFTVADASSPIIATMLEETFPDLVQDAPSPTENHPTP